MQINVTAANMTGPNFLSVAAGDTDSTGGRGTTSDSTTPQGGAGGGEGTTVAVGGAAGCGGSVGVPDDERHAGGFLPQGELAEVVLFAERVAVVGPKDDDCVVGVGARGEGIEAPSDVEVRP